MRTYIGCSGYYYREWKGPFYPEGLPSTKWLRHYAAHFNTLEINSTFYKMPTLRSLAKWYQETPPDFHFTIKANKLFTHFRRMQGIEQEQRDFMDTVQEALREKVRCILYQFPASFKYSEARLELLLRLNGAQIPHVLEFRDISWWEESVRLALQSAGLHICNISLPDFPDIFGPDPKLLYLRFHGKPILYKSGYGQEGLSEWASQVLLHPPEELIVYFNNTWFGEAIKDARHFRQLCGEPDYGPQQPELFGPTTDDHK